MNEQQPHLEILSRNRVNRSTIIVAVIPVSLFSGALIYAIWPFLTWIAIGVLTLAVICALYLVALLAIDVRRRWIHAHVIHLGEYGVVDAMGWRMLPLELSPPQTIITEQPNKDDDELSRSKALLYHDIGWSIQRIAKEIDVKPWRVQQWTSAYEQAKEAKKQQQAKQTNGV